MKLYKLIRRDNAALAAFRVLNLMLKRSLTAIPLIILVLLGIFFTSMEAFAVLSALVFLYAAFEWGRLSGLKLKGQLLYLSTTLLAFIFLGFTHAFFILSLTAVWWLFSIILLFRFNRAPTHYKNLHSSIPRFLNLFFSILIISAAWLGLNTLRLGHAGPVFLLFNLLIVWASDTGAYFAGKYAGKHFLAPQISPKKTVEGVLGGLIASLFVAGGEALYLNLTCLPAIKFILLGVIAGGACMVGDLYESMLKRIHHVKDSGAIFPGHGGLLDRVDGLLAATPFFTLGVLYSPQMKIPGFFA